jgi:hypothetical protein
MDPLTIGALVVVGYLLLNKSSAGTGAAAPSAGNASQAPSSALAKLLSKVQQQLKAPAQSQQKPSSSGFGSGSGGGPGNGNSKPAPASAAKKSGAAPPNPASDPSMQLADQNQAAAYQAALDAGNTTLANAILGNVDPMMLESDPNAGVVDSQLIDLQTAPVLDLSNQTLTDQQSSDLWNSFTPSPDPNSADSSTPPPDPSTFTPAPSSFAPSPLDTSSQDVTSYTGDFSGGSAYSGDSSSVDSGGGY